MYYVIDPNGLNGEMYGPFNSYVTCYDWAFNKWPSRTFYIFQPILVK